MFLFKFLMANHEIFHTEQCVAGNWIFSKSWKFFGFFWEFYGEFFWEEFFGGNFLGGIC